MQMYVPIAVCPGCSQDVLNDDQGRVVDAQGGVWHPECRKAARRKSRGGRPRKQVEEQVQS